ncbi:MAG: patatin-like phospholipase family protein [Gammaproteobacteria bacterium]
MSRQGKIALVMTGGGAHAAYQVGVLLALSKMLPKTAVSPFSIICGTSAGAINAVALACYADNFRHAVSQMVSVWANFSIDQVIRADAPGLIKTGAHWMLAMMLAGLGRQNPLSLLDRQPLHDLLSRHMPLDNIQQNIDAGLLHAVSVTASGYASGQSVTFFQGHEAIPTWQRINRVGCREALAVDHLMASSAIPFLFAPVKIHREFFGDGSMRQMAPLSAPLHLQAERMLIIGNKPDDSGQSRRVQEMESPSMAEIAGHVLNSIFLDSMEADLERLHRINNTITLIPDHHLRDKGIDLRRVEARMISPSRDLAQIAQPYASELPRTMKLLLRGIGALHKKGSTLMSYLLFEKAYCRELIRLGYQDTLRDAAAIKRYIEE